MKSAICYSHCVFISLFPSGSFVAIIHLCLFVLTLIEYSFITLNSQLFFTFNGKTNAFSGRDMTTIISHRDKDRDSLRESPISSGKLLEKDMHVSCQ